MVDIVEIAKLEDFLVDLRDGPPLGFCIAGIRDWMNQHGMDFRAALRNGVSAREFLRHGDSRAESIARASWVKLNEGSGGR